MCKSSTLPKAKNTVLTLGSLASLRRAEEYLGVKLILQATVIRDGNITIIQLGLPLVELGLSASHMAMERTTMIERTDCIGWSAGMCGTMGRMRCHLRTPSNQCFAQVVWHVFALINFFFVRLLSLMSPGHLQVPSQRDLTMARSYFGPAEGWLRCEACES